MAPAWGQNVDFSIEAALPAAFFLVTFLIGFFFLAIAYNYISLEAPYYIGM